VCGEPADARVVEARNAVQRPRGRAVVDDEHLEVHPLLGEGAPQGGGEEVRSVLGRNDDGDGAHRTIIGYRDWRVSPDVGELLAADRRPARHHGP
jgi:hypothetical protein